MRRQRHSGRVRLSPCSAALALIAAATLPTSAWAAGPPRAKLAVYPAASAVSHSANWTLAKTGSLDDTTNTVTWHIAANPNGRRTLVLEGRTTILNLGTASAPLGNIVVSLQVKNAAGAWRTLASNVATASQGDGATAAWVIGPSNNNIDEDADDPSTQMFRRRITESAGSGSLTLTRNGSAPYSLSPKRSIGPGQSLDLRFRAMFNNTVLKLAPGRQIRAEIIVSSGNAGNVAGTLARVDIDGNGSISGDEARVRSKARHLAAKALPAPSAAPAPVTISDTAADITTTGTVSFSNPVFNVGATSGTVRVNVAAGADGGEIKNCARLTGSGVSLQACRAVAIGPSTNPSPHEWVDGEVITYSQESWGNSPTPGNAAQNLRDGFTAVYGGGTEIGSAPRTLLFTTGDDALTFLPSTGPVGIISISEVNPTSSTAGQFGGEILALSLNINFAAAGRLGGTEFGSVEVCSTGLAGIDGLTMHELLAVANVALTGGPTPVHPVFLDDLLRSINGAFEAGAVTQFARDHLFRDGCPWADGEWVTFAQDEWSDDPNGLFTNNYSAVYPNGAVAIGSLAGFTAVFSSAQNIRNYLPVIGLPAAFVTNYIDPIQTSSNSFGGNVLALKLNTDYADQGLLQGSLGLPFGDLVVCRTNIAGIDGSSVRDILATANTSISGASSAVNLQDVATVAFRLTDAFRGGRPSVFAQAHLAIGACH